MDLPYALTQAGDSQRTGQEEKGKQTRLSTSVGINNTVRFAGGVPANPVALYGRRWRLAGFSARLTIPLPHLAILSHDHPYLPNSSIAAKTTSLTNFNQDHGHNEDYKQA